MSSNEMDHLLKIFACRKDFRAGCRAGAAIDDHYFDIGSKPQLAPSAFSESKDRYRTWAAIFQTRPAILPVHFVGAPIKSSR